jgi:transposase
MENNSPISRTFIGIDVSKDTLEVAYPKTGKSFKTLTVDNKPFTIWKLLKTFDASQDQIILEATGTYSLLLCHLLSKAGIPFSLLNPRQSTSYAKMQGKTVKTDKVDAVLLSQLGKQIQPPVTVLKDASWYELQAHRAYLRQLKKQRTMLLNLQASFQPSPYPNKTVTKNLQTHLNFIETQIKELERDQAPQSEDYQQLFEKITSIAGIGEVTAHEIIACTNGFEDFDNPKAFAKFIGICPTYRQSGTSVKSFGRMNRSGNPHLRSVLYMAAKVAKRWNKDCQASYERLRAKGKTYKQAIVAVMNQLIRQVFAIVKANTIFENGYNLAKIVQAKNE